jgi:hypothetical protein
VRRRSVEVRRRRSGVSGEVESNPWLWELHWGPWKLSRGSDEAGSGLVGRSTVAMACAAAGTSLTGKTPANLSLGWVSGAWGCTVEAVMAFIAVGAGLRAWAEHRGRALARQNASNTCAFVSALIQIPAGITNVRISPRVLCRSLPGT